MRTGTFAVLMAGLWMIVGGAAYSAPSNDCKRCAEQQRACKANYSAATCKTEFDICMKGCGRK